MVSGKSDSSSDYQSSAVLSMNYNIRVVWVNLQFGYYDDKISC